MTLAALFPLDASAPHHGYRPADPAASPVVSVVTPVFNTGAILLETAETLLRQTFQAWEWLIVNDGSTDATTLRALLPLRSADARIRVIDTPNCGLPAARNTGAAAARASLLFFLDSDDLLAPTALESLVWKLHTSPAAAFATSWVTTFGAESVLIRTGFATTARFPYDNVVTPLVLMRRAVFAALGGFDASWRDGLEDYEFWVRAAANGYWGVDVPLPLLWVRRKPASAYASYHWSFQRDPRARARGRATLQSRHPQLFRDGPPRPRPPAAGLLETYAPLITLPLQNALAPHVGQRRILLLLPWLQVGGSDRFALDLIAGLVARGDGVTVALMQPSDNPLLAEALRLTADVLVLPAFLTPAAYPAFLRELVLSRGIDAAIIANALLAYQLLPYLHAHCPQLALLDFNHNTQPNRHGGFPRASLDHAALLDAQLVASGSLRKWMLDAGGEATQIIVQHLGVDAQRYAPDSGLRARIRADLGIDAATPLVVFVGRMTPQKRPRLLAQILHTLRDRGTRFVAIAAGDGEDLAWMRRFARRHQMGAQLQLPGRVSHTRVRELLAAADIVLLPSAYEGIALTLFEALAAGVPVVAADVNGQAELVTPDCGILIPPGPDEMAAYVDALSNLLADPRRRTQLGAAGRARITADFTLATMSTRISQQLDVAIARAAARPTGSDATGHANAVLAVEAYTLRERLRTLAPMRAILNLRHSSAWSSVERLSAHLPRLSALDRRLYIARRVINRALRRARGKPVNW